MVTPEPDNLEADLSAYLDGELSESRRQAVEHLLAESAETRRALEDLRQVRDQLAALPRVQLPAKLADSLVRRAEAELTSRSAPAARRARLLRLSGPLTAVAAVLVMGLLIGYQALEPYLAPRFKLLPSTPSADRVAKSEPPVAAAREPQEPAFAARGGAAESKKPEGPAPAVPAQPKSLGHAKAPPPADNKAAPAPAAVAPPESPLAEASAEESSLATSVAVVIQTQHKADYVSNAAVLASWGAGAPAVAGDQPIEQVYQVQAPELASRLNQILAANPRGQVEVQQNRASADSPVVAQVAEALGASVVNMGVPLAADAEGDRVADSSLRPGSGEGGGTGGAEAAKSQRRLAGRESEAVRAELHRRHMAVTEEPDLTIVLMEPPAAPSGVARAPQAKEAAPPAAQTPKEALLDQLTGLLLRGGPRGRAGQQNAQQSAQPITLRVRLLPPPSSTPTAPATTSPAVPQAP